MKVYNHSFVYDRERQEYDFQIRARFQWWLLVILIVLVIAAAFLVFSVFG